MRIKSYFAATVEDGMAMARGELGPDAMLVTSRRTTADARHLGEYEVVIATDVVTDAAAVTAARRGMQPVSRADCLGAELAELKKEMAAMRRALARPAAGGPRRGSAAESSEACGALAASEIPPELMNEIVLAAEARLLQIPEGERAAAFERAVAEELESRIRVEPALGRAGAVRKAVALVGPPGAGKTATLVKLAVKYGVAARRPLLVLSLDTYRIFAAEQMRSFASILGAGFQVLESVEALAHALGDRRGDELILIDTPGMTAAEVGEFFNLSRFLASRQDVDTQLVVSSSMKSADVTRVVDSFEPFAPQRLIFTRLDETSTFGALAGESARTGKPLSFFGTGQRIPEDLETASAGRVVELILGRAAPHALAAGAAGFEP